VEMKSDFGNLRDQSRDFLQSKHVHNVDDLKDALLEKTVSLGHFPCDDQLTLLGRFPCLTLSSWEL